MRILLLLTAFASIAVDRATAAGNDFEIVFESKTECDAGDSVTQGKDSNGKTIYENGKYKVVEAYIFWTDDNGKVLGLAVCSVPGAPRCDEDVPFPSGYKKTYLAIAVTLKKGSFEDQNIHYQYYDELFKLSNIASVTTDDQKIHKLTNFLFPKTANYKGKLRFSGGDCRQDRAKSLISGHGYFITEFKDNSNKAASWDNLYYLPHRIGQYIKTPN